MSNIHVIGISSPIALSEKTRAILKEAGIILASRRLLDLFLESGEAKGFKEKCRTIDDVEKTIAFLGKYRKDAVVLASGDPLFFGIGKRLLDEIPNKNIEFYPAITSMQAAFSKVKQSWEDAFFISLHGSRRREWAVNDLPLLCELHGKLAILTGGENTPSRIAGVLPSGVKVYVLERIGYDDERVRWGSPAEIKKMKFREPNLMLAISPQAEHAAFGLTEAEFRRFRGLITKDEVRAVVLHKLRLPRKGVLWDIGAGSGSVSIEAKRLSPELEVYAIEKSASNAEIIKANIRKLNAGEATVVNGEAPQALRRLPPPDRIFIGGSGRGLKPVIRHVSNHLRRGIIVITAITFESLADATNELRRFGLEPEVVSVSISRAATLNGRHYMKALNPIFVIRAVR